MFPGARDPWSDFECRARPPDVTACGDPRFLDERYVYIELYCNWKHWICVFPQHGAGRKHLRPITLMDWQRQLVERFPKALLRGLIHSDGCRSINRVRRPTRDGLKSYEYPRYYFTNASVDIRGLFLEACELAGVEARRMTERDISVARRQSVALMDSFIGPKS